MKKIVVGMTAAAALAASTFAPQSAKAMDPISAWWLLPAFVGGLVVAGSWHHPAYAAPRGAYYEYGPVYGPAPRGAYYAEPAPRAQVYARGTVRSRY